MTTTKLDNLTVNHPKIASFIQNLIIAGVTLDSLYLTQKKELVVIPKGKENVSSQWFKTTFFTKQMADKAIRLALVG
jgi:hypothetical protein